MGIFDRVTMETITQTMIDWSRGVTTQLTDFRVGSKNRTIYEAVAIILERLNDRTFKAIKKAVVSNLYTAFGFAPLPATNSTGTIRFYAKNPPSVSQPFYIPMGTQIQTNPSGGNSPVSYQTTQDAYVYYNNSQETSGVSVGGSSVAGWFYVDVPIVCAEAGKVGNVGANTIQTLVGTPAGISLATNPSLLSSGKEAETLAQQKARFQAFVTSRTRGTLDSVRYAATTAQIMDGTGSFVQESVSSAVVVDGDGTFDLYVWNGVGVASSALLDQVTKIITGYTDDTGTRIWGYKPAGVTFTCHSVAIQNVSVSVTVTPYDGYAVSDGQVALGGIDLRPSITNALSSYFASVIPGQTVLKTALASVIKQIPGVYDVTVTTPSGNVTVSATNMAVLSLPVTFSVGTTV